MSIKNPLTPSGIEPATFRFVTQRLNHCVTAVPVNVNNPRKLPRILSHVVYRVSVSGCIVSQNFLCHCTVDCEKGRQCVRDSCIWRPFVTLTKVMPKRLSVLYYICGDAMRCSFLASLPFQPVLKTVSDSLFL